MPVGSQVFESVALDEALREWVVRLGPNVDPGYFKSSPVISN
jgi:hypothetical protein